jgi:hypothetical protein
VTCNKPSAAASSPSQLDTDTYLRYQDLTEWAHLHGPTLHWAVVQALVLPRQPTRGQTHALVVNLKHQKDPNQKVELRFAINKCSVEPFEDIRKNLGARGTEIFEQLDAGREQTKDKFKAGSPGVVLCVLLSEGLVHSVPMAFSDDISAMPVRDDWERVVRSAIEAGLKVG